ncbi:MAG: PTS system mannose/fructose/sorbose family transporter subunit IID, partial [Staphylococcus equorum]|nr:PTS system mannose/fructose/sorbose family transporter subunit IID [Staphylococcus equorum]
MSTEEMKITKHDLNRVFWRMQLLNVTNNFQSLQAIGFLSSFIPVLERLYEDQPKELKTNAMKRHLEFFNSHVNSDALILGIAAAIEETTDEEEKQTVTDVKTGMMGPLAGIGDSILKFTWLPICGSIGAS